MNSNATTRAKENPYILIWTMNCNSYKKTNLTPETGIKTKDTTNEQNQSVRKSKRIPHAKQTEKLGGIPYQTNNNKKKTNKHCVLQENPTTPPDQTQTNSEEERDDRKIRTITKNLQNNRIIRTLNSKQPYKPDFIRRGGNVEYRDQTARLHNRYFRQRVVYIIIYKQTLIDSVSFMF